MTRLRHAVCFATCFAITPALPAGAAPAGRPGQVLGRLTVDAGKLERRNTPVTVSLPPELAGKALEVGGSGTKGWHPLTVEPGGRAFFMLLALKPGRRLELILREARADNTSATSKTAGVEVVQDEAGLWLKVAGKQVLRYQAKASAPAGMREDFLRGGYLHPVLTPGGTAVTDDYPADHKHHHGIWTAWTHTEYEGRQPDFWNMGSKKARKDHVAVGETFAGGAAGGFVARLSSTDLGATPPRVVIAEQWKVIAYRTTAAGARAPAPYHLFDLEWTDTVQGSAPLKLPEYRYGGLGVRGPIDWLGETSTSFLTSEGKDRATAENTPARWCHMGGRMKEGGKLAGIAALDHPANFRHPQPLRISPNQPYFVYSPMKAGPFQLDAGKPFVSRYRFVVSDGPADPALLERLWKDYADPPVATLTLAP